MWKNARPIVSRCASHHHSHPYSIRFYRGEAQDSPPKPLSASEEALLKIAKPKYDTIYKKHTARPDMDSRRKRLLYRSKQRGWLEVDLLLGTWASENIDTLTPEELDQYEDFVNLETIDIYNVITLRVDALQTPFHNDMVSRIQEWAKQSPLGKADPEKYKQVKVDAKLI